MSTTTVVGHVLNDPGEPELQHQPWHPEPRAGFVLVVDNLWTHPTTNKVHRSECRFRVRCRGDVAENVLRSVREGDRLIVSGTVVVREALLGGVVPAQLMTLMADEVGMALSFHRIDPPIDDE